MSKLLTDCGEAMYGPRWQSELSRDLEVSDRTMRRWASGADAVPPGVWPDILQIAEKRATALGQLVDRLKRHTDSPDRPGSRE